MGLFRLRLTAGTESLNDSNEEAGSFVKIQVILTGMLWSFLPLWEEATCARY